MNVTGASVNEHIGYINKPTLQLYVQDQAANGDFVYRSRPFGRSTLYFAEFKGEVRFMSHDPNNEYGYGGTIFRIRMEDGTERDVRGPWSSRAGVMSPLFRPVVDVDLIGEYRTAGHVTLEVAQAAVDMFLPDWELIQEQDDEKIWRPKHKAFV